MYFPAVYSRRLHTRESGEFKRQNGMPAMKKPGLLPQGYGLAMRDALFTDRASGGRQGIRLP
ncbi:hypothetical protein, partial [Mesorhizobium sp.]|uniref:hypothetical protein n=1 Tax=Mesorhizobium sp. TaxID=1871066 RepID=UPI0025CCD26E